jgi:TonB-dependent receptor
MEATKIMKSTKLFLVSIVVVLTLLTTQAFSQITGRVIDADQNLGLPGANVVISELNRGVATDADGYFSFTGIADGQYTLRFSYLGYQTVTEMVVVEGGMSDAVTVFMESGVLINDELIVLGDRLRGQAKALNQQRNNTNITNIVSADQVGRFPDANIGDAIKRIPGITIQMDQGEARFGLIRGTAPRLNSITINGERVPSAEAETRVVQLDLVPSDMIQTVEVNKALTPDMDADAIGGSVNLVTRGAPTGPRVSATMGSGYNFLRSKPTWLGSVILSNRFMDDKFGVIVSGSIHDHKLGSHNIEAVWDGDDSNAFVDEFDQRLYVIQRVRRSLSASLDYKFDPNNTVRFKGIYNHRDDWENRYRQRFAKFEDNGDGTALARIRRQTKAGLDSDRIKNARLEDQRATTLTLSGDHLVADIVQLDWSAGYARASEDRPNERYIRYEVKDILVDYDLSDPNKPGINFISNIPNSDFELDELTEEFMTTTDTDITAKFNLTIPFGNQTVENSLKAGAKLKYKSKDRDYTISEYKPLVNDYDLLSDVPFSDQTVDGYLAGDYVHGDFSDPEFLGGLDLTNSGLFESEELIEDSLPANFEANETVTSAYAMYSRDLTDQLFLLAGVRMENTAVDYTGNQLVLDEDGDLDNNQIQEISDSDNYTNIMPSVHLKYTVNPSAVVRLAWTNTIARPNYFDLVPYRQVNFEDNELAEGNPELQPTTSMNVDLMAEYYFESVGLLSAGVFYKDVNDFIYFFQSLDYTDAFSGNTFDAYFQPQNGEGGQLYGFEIAAQRQLDFLPGLLRNVGLYANYTLTQSSVETILNEDGEARDDINLPGTAEHTFNASVSYETEKFNARLSLNYTSDYLDELGEVAFFDRYYDSQTFVDANINYTITPNVRIFMEANNLTNQPLRYYQGIQSRMMQEEFYDVRFNAGIKIDF